MTKPLPAWAVDLTDHTFHAWTVVYDPGVGDHGVWRAGRQVTCVCQCGTRRKVRVGRLLKNKSQGCGQRHCVIVAGKKFPPKKPKAETP